MHGALARGSVGKILVLDVFLRLRVRSQRWPCKGWGFFVANFSKVALSAIALWILAAVGLTCFVWSRKAGAHADFVLGLLFFSALGVSAGLYFRGHYFILLLPVVSLLVGLAVASAADFADHGKRSIFGYVAVGVFVLSFVTSLFQQSYFFFQADPIAASRYVYPNDPFPEAEAVGSYIQEHSSPSARVAVLGSEPQLIFYSRRRSASGYLYGYSLTEEQEYAAVMQREDISEIEAARPEFLVFVRDWVVREGSDTSIFSWSDRYVAQNYELVGVMRVRDGLQLRSETEIRRAPGNLTGALFLFRRKTS